jgi:hypothetical protein
MPKPFQQRSPSAITFLLFDQEQGSTKENIIVLEHYFLDILKLPETVFDRTMFFVLGDHLTTVHDRVAQDIHAVDWSSHHMSEVL